MSLVVALGSNLGDRQANLRQARESLLKHFQLIKFSSILESAPVDYFDQPYFLNQLGEFKIPNMTPEECLQILLAIELNQGRLRTVPKGPRIIDLDIIFWGHETFETKKLQVPHPRWKERTFITLPLQELPFSSEYFSNIHMS